MGKNNVKLELTAFEEEILIFKAVVESIDSMLNHEILILNHIDPNSEISFHSSTHQKYFNIILLDFLHAKIFGIGKTCMEALRNIMEKPLYGASAAPLKNAVDGFYEWLDENVEFEHNGVAQKLWFPSRDVNISLKITRQEFVEICGNISKHNLLGLDRQAKIIMEIFKRSDEALKQTEAIMIMEEFYEHFHDNMLTYHSSAIAEFLNNLRWAVHEYLQPLREKSFQEDRSESHNKGAPVCTCPDDVRNPYIKEIFWDLMNDVHRGPYFQKFVITQYLKMRY